MLHFRQPLWNILVVAGLLVTGAVCRRSVMANEASAAPKFPSEYRSWRHVKSAAVTPAHPAFVTEGGLHHIYANPTAVEGYSDGQFADGSVIVYELLATVEKNGIVSEGARRRVDVMSKDSRRYPETGGWSFRRFYEDPGATTKDAADARMCFECHKSVRSHGLVFSRIR